MLRQSVAWLSGFVNYTVSVLLALIFIDYIYKVFRGEETKDTKSGIALFAVLGFASALLVEHFTLYCAVIAAGLMIYVKAKKQKIQIKNFTYLAGVLAGAVLMFSNSAYIKIFSGKDFYRKTINEDIDRASEFLGPRLESSPLTLRHLPCRFSESRCHVPQPPQPFPRRFPRQRLRDMGADSSYAPAARRYRPVPGALFIHSHVDSA